MTATAILGSELESFIDHLVTNQNGRTKIRLKHGGGLATFVTAIVDLTGGRSIAGRISGPYGNHANYVLKYGKSGKVLISIDLEDPAGTYSGTQAYADLTNAIKKMMTRPDKKPDFSNGRNTKNHKGFYLINTGKNKVGVTGKKTLKFALDEDQISQAFHDHCIHVGFTMEHY